MLHICRICLRTDRDIKAKDNVLSYLFDELCDSDTAALSRFCTECSYMLTKFKDFKERCCQASTILHSWLNAAIDIRPPLCSLSAKMPQSRLGLLNKNNFKIYLSRDFQSDYSTTFDSLSSAYPHIVSVDIPATDTLNKPIKVEIVSHYDNDTTEAPVKVKEEVDIDNTHESCYFEEVYVNYDASNVNDTALISKSYNSDENVDSPKPFDVRPDSTDDGNRNVARKKKVTRKRKQLSIHNSSDGIHDECEPGRPKRNRKSKKISLDELKDRLVERFRRSGKLTDEHGNLMDTDVVLNNLDIMPLLTLRQLKNQVASGFSPQILKPESIQLLADLHKKYSNKKSKFISVNKISNVRSDDLITNSDNSTDDTSDDEVIANLVQRNAIEKGKSSSAHKTNTAAGAGEANAEIRVKRVRGKAKISLEQLRRSMVVTFSKFDELKDEEGNDIDTDMILNSLGDIGMRTLRRLKRMFASGCSKDARSPKAMRLLSVLNKRFTNQYSNGFSVEYLTTKELMLAEFEKRQYYDHYVMAEHKCRLCYKAFRYARELANHIKNCHNEKNPYACSVCKVRYNKESSFRWHFIKHRTVCKCKLCPFVTPQKSTMVIHYNQHKGVIYTCEICNTQFKSKSGQYLHMNTAHRDKNSSVCTICERVFSSEFGLKIHRHKAHQGKEPDNPGQPDKELQGPGKRELNVVSCPLCKKPERCVNALKQHFKLEHPGESCEAHYTPINSGTHNHLCHMCGKAFRTTTALDEHKNLHTGARPYTCDACGATFARKGSLHTHVETHMPPTKECNICGKKFKRDVLLTNHMSYHKPPTLECHLCKKKFSTSSNLNCHMRMHIGDRKYKCDMCSKTFLHSSARNAHVRGVHDHIRRMRRNANTN